MVLRLKQLESDLDFATAVLLGGVYLIFKYLWYLLWAGLPVLLVIALLVWIF